MIQQNITCQWLDLGSTMTLKSHGKPHVFIHGELVMTIYDTLCPWGKS